MIQLRGEESLRVRPRPAKHAERLSLRNRLVGKPVQPSVALGRAPFKRVRQEHLSVAPVVRPVTAVVVQFDAVA